MSCHHLPQITCDECIHAKEMYRSDFFPPDSEGIYPSLKGPSPMRTATDHAKILWCVHCYCIEVQEIRSMNVNHKMCCNCGNKQKV